MDKYQVMYQELQEIPSVDGIAPTDVLSLPEHFERLLRTLMRKGSMTVEEVANELDLPVNQAQNLGDVLIEKGYLRAEGGGPDTGPVYRVYFARVRKRNIPAGLFD